jgi:hypothetical protein
MTASNIAVPGITGTTYDASTGALVVTGSGFLSMSGASNDIVANKFTLSGEGGTTYTLTDTANVEITSGTSFTLTLSATDQAAISNEIINKNGGSAGDATTYNLAAGEDWAAGADAAVIVADTTGNGITASNVDTTSPAISSVGVPADATYVAGQNLDFTVNFDEAVIVNTAGGTPRIAITLDTGGIVYADYLSGSGSTVLTFRYTVASGNADADGITVGALTANGGTLKDTVGNDATLTLSSVGNTTAVLVDAKAPAITSAGVPADATYVAGQNLDFTVTYDEAVTVNSGGGTPYLSVTLDTGGVVHADYLGGSGTNTLTFRYTVVSGTLDSSGITVGSAITGNGATLKDAAGNDAATTGIAFGSTAAVLVDAVAPGVSSIVRTGSALTNSTSVDYTVTFSENVTGVDASDFALTATGSAAGSIASVTQVSGSTYTVTVDSVSGDGTLRLDLNGAATGITDVPGNAITAGFTGGQTYTLDHTAPAISSVGVPADAIYAAGQNLDFTVNFNEVISVDTTGGTPRIAITLETGGTVYASYLSGSGSNALVFRYSVAAGVADNDGIALAGTLDNNGGTLRDAAGNDASLGLNSVGNTAGVLVDAIVPTATITVADTSLKVGDTTTVTFTFSEAVFGFSNADLTVANGTLGGLVSIDGGLTWTATFTPTNAITDTSNLITLDNTGVVDVTGNAGVGTTNSNNYAIDTARPTATVVVAETELAAGETTTVTITFSEAVSGFTNADLDLGIANGTLSTVGSSDGGITWTATFTPTADITDANNLITLDNAGVVDQAGNSGTGTTNSNNYTIDTARPTATVVVADNALAAGETSTVTITFNEAVTGFYNSDLTLANGSMSAV